MFTPELSSLPVEMQFEMMHQDVDFLFGLSGAWWVAAITLLTFAISYFVGKAQVSPRPELFKSLLLGVLVGGLLNLLLFSLSSGASPTFANPATALACGMMCAIAGVFVGGLLMRASPYLNFFGVSVLALLTLSIPTVMLHQTESLISMSAVGYLMSFVLIAMVSMSIVPLVVTMWDAIPMRVRNALDPSA